MCGVNVFIIVVINKMDKFEVNFDCVKVDFGV